MAGQNNGRLGQRQTKTIADPDNGRLKQWQTKTLADQNKGRPTQWQTKTMADQDKHENGQTRSRAPLPATVGLRARRQNRAVQRHGLQAPAGLGRCEQHIRAHWEVSRG